MDETTASCGTVNRMTSAAAAIAVNVGDEPKSIRRGEEQGGFSGIQVNLAHRVDVWVRVVDVVAHQTDLVVEAEEAVEGFTFVAQLKDFRSRQSPVASSRVHTNTASPSKASKPI